MVILDVNDMCKLPLQISRGIFVYGEILKMHLFHESNYTLNGSFKKRRGPPRGFSCV